MGFYEAAGVYLNSNRSQDTETVLSGSMTLTVERAAVGATVTGKFEFTTAKRKLESTIAGNVILIG